MEVEQESQAIDPQAVNRFWIEEVGPSRWYAVDEELDAKIESRFGDAAAAAAAGAFADWSTAGEGALALLILLDQFPRNLHRGDAAAFASDDRARRVAKGAITRGLDMKIAEPQRQFFYLPLMHAESIEDQDRCVRLILMRMPETGAENLKHAVAHREVVRRFGRFPHRNEALGRESSAAEADYLASGGYSA
ncbi:MAG: DUF924 family protein [Pseudomonadota bacterium]